MNPTCRACNNSFEVTSADEQFYQSMDLPLPKMCHLCRRQHLVCWRNQRTLYSRKESLNGKTIISVFAPESDYVVYDRDYWWSDKWDALQYGQDVDFSKPFFEQFNGLMHRVPMAGIFNGKT
ncbi:hypothetical protein HY224_02180 [Candidatus Uhrbacteria bacterium]|nr:hypothetical protein [Candidatus Uhrbacteria bacterium]